MPQHGPSHPAPRMSFHFRPLKSYVCQVAFPPGSLIKFCPSFETYIRCHLLWEGFLHLSPSPSLWRYRHSVLCTTLIVVMALYFHFLLSAWIVTSSTMSAKEYLISKCWLRPMRYDDSTPYFLCILCKHKTFNSGSSFSMGFYPTCSGHPFLISYIFTSPSRLRNVHRFLLCMEQPLKIF